MLIINITLFANFEAAAYPSAGYSNETGLYGGVITYLRFTPQDSISSNHKNMFYLTTSYTEKKQFILKLKPELYFNQSLNRLEIELLYKKWPSNFYGIGMNTDLHNFERYSSIAKSLITTFSRKINDFWEISLYSEYVNYAITENDVDGMLSSATTLGGNGSITTGMGLIFSYDDRNVTAFPTQGSLLIFQVNSFSEVLKSDFEFSEYILDLRKYFPLNNANTLALQSYLSTIRGEAPFNQMNYLNDYMRAVTSNLYINKSAFILRAEDRVFIWNDGFKKRLGFALFIEMGEVASRIDNLNLNNLQLNYGFGFRYSFFLEDRMNVRLDIGFAEGQSNISISAGEVF